MSHQRMDRQQTDEVGSTATVLLLIDSERNRELLADQLGETFDIRFDENPFEHPNYDLCLLDDQSLREYEEQLQQTKSDSTPTFRPHLLLTGQRSPDEFSEDVWDIVDEIIQRPVSKAELDTRIENLLQRRRLSVELTEQKERSEQRFESLFESTPDPVVVVRPDGTVTEVNDAFARIFGVESEQIQQKSITELEFTPAESVERVLLRIADEDPASTTVEWGRDAEEELVMELNTDVISGVGQAAERIGIFRDVTERTQRKAELQRQNERLEEFADTIAHDLRNPLSVAQGRLEFAQRTGDEEHFDVINDAHERMEQMIEELLSLAKQGQAVLDPDPLRLEDAVERAWNNVQTPEALLEQELDRTVIITADEGRLCELFENLFRNAIDHCGENVTVRIGILPDNAGFYIEDDGAGIPVDKRSEVFEAGYSDAPDGTGFGLSIVQQIVDGHEWDISITDSATGGARFEISNVQLETVDS